MDHDTHRDQASTGTSPGSRARDHMANERTFLAWLRTAANVMVVGLAVAQFAGDGSSSIYSLAAGGMLVLTGALGLAYGGLRYRAGAREIDDEHYVTGARSRGPLTAATILTLAITAALTLLLLGESTTNGT